MILPGLVEPCDAFHSYIVTLRRTRCKYHFLSLGSYQICNLLLTQLQSQVSQLTKSQTVIKTVYYINYRFILYIYN